MNFAKAPRSVVLVLSLMALVSFGAGLWLEFAHGDELQKHPYLSNLLSGVTGFSTSALAAVVALNVVFRRARIKQWRVEMVRCLQAVASSAEGIANVLGSLVGEPRYGDADWMRDDVLSGLRRLATDIRSKGRSLDPDTMPEPEDWQTLLRRVTRFTTYVMPRVVKAFEPGEDPTIIAPWQTIEGDLGMLGHLGSDRGYGNPRQVNTARNMCERMGDLLDAIAQNKSIADAYRDATSDLPPEMRLSEI